MQNIKISGLKKHPRNEEFFDDIYGQRWDDFKESVRRRGIVEPIVVTQDLMVVSGHQRVRACEEMGILEIPCRITHYPDYDEQFHRAKEDMILEDLICTNIMQRGVGNVNPMKMAKCIMELERIKGIRQGSAGKGSLEQDNLTPKYSQEDLSNELQISKQQLQDYKKLTNLIPELQQMIENGSMKATVGYKIWAKMPQDEQEKFFNDIGREKIKTLTQKATQQYIDEIKNLEKELEVEKNKKPKTIVKEIEKVIDNTDYTLENKLKNIKEELENKNRLYNIAKEKEIVLKEQLELYKEDEEKYNKLTRSIELLTKEKDDISRAVTSATELSGYIYKIEEFLKNELAPIKYSRSLMDCKDNPVVISNVTEIVECVENWCREIRNCLPSNQQNIINVEVL